MKTVYDNPQSSTRELALQVEKDLGLRVSHETIRKVLENHKYSSASDQIRATGRPKRVERKIMKTVYDNPQSSTRGLALQVEKDLGLRVSHETIRKVLENHKYSSRVARNNYEL